MNSDLHGRWFRSRALTFATGDQLAFDLNFLAGARHMTAPEVWKIGIVFSGTITPVGGTALGADGCKLYDEVTIRDEAEFVKCSGQGLRLLEQVEVGAKQQDLSDMTVAAGAVAVKQRSILHVAPSPNRAVRPRDFTMPIYNFLEGGNFLVNCAAAVPTNYGVVAADWKVQLFFLVRDGRVRELKSRRRILEQVVQNQEYQYPVNGSMRGAYLHSKLTTTGQTDLSGFGTLYSQTLDFPPSMDTHMLVDDYRNSSESLGSNDAIIAGKAIPLVFPRKDKKTGEMIDAKFLHVDLLQAAPASGRLLTDTVVDRPPNISALAEGYGSPESMAAAIESHGEIVSGNGPSYKASKAPPSLARRLPIRIKS